MREGGGGRTKFLSSRKKSHRRSQRKPFPTGSYADEGEFAEGRGWSNILLDGVVGKGVLVKNLEENIHDQLLGEDFCRGLPEK